MKEYKLGMGGEGQKIEEKVSQTVHISLKGWRAVAAWRTEAGRLLRAGVDAGRGVGVLPQVGDIHALLVHPERENIGGLIAPKGRTSVLLYLFTLRVITALEVGMLMLANQCAHHLIEQYTWKTKLRWEKPFVNIEYKQQDLNALR